jgi:hypothetical protein
MLSRLPSSANSIFSAAGRLQNKRQKIHLLILLMGRLLALAAALALMIYSVSWASDGLWDAATILFIAGMIFFIPIILFGRNIKAIKKVRKYSKKNNTLIGRRYSGN